MCVHAQERGWGVYVRANRKLRLATGVFLNPSHLILRQGLSVNLGIVVLERLASQRSLDSQPPASACPAQCLHNRPVPIVPGLFMRALEMKFSPRDCEIDKHLCLSPAPVILGGLRRFSEMRPWLLVQASLRSLPHRQLERPDCLV